MISKTLAFFRNHTVVKEGATLYFIFATTKSNHMKNEALVERMRDYLFAKNVTNEEKRMFGGVAFMIRGSMCVGVTNKGELMVRIHPEEHAAAIKKSGARSMEYGRGPMPGFLFIDERGCTTDKDLRGWIELSLKYNAILPEKQSGEKKNSTKTVVAKKSGAKNIVSRKVAAKKVVAKKTVVQKATTAKSVKKKK